MQSIKTEIFKFLSIRAPKLVSETEPTGKFIRYPTDQLTAAKKTLYQALTSPSVTDLTAAQSAVTAFEKTTQYFLDTNQVRIKHPGFRQIREWVEQNKDSSNSAAMIDEIKTIVGSAPDKIVASPDYINQLAIVWDNLLAETIHPVRPGMGEELSNHLRINAIIWNLASSITYYDAPGLLTEAIGATILLPSTIFPLSMPPLSNADAEEAQQDSGADTNDSLTAVNNTRQAIQELLDALSFQAQQTQNQSDPALTIDKKSKSKKPATNAADQTDQRQLSTERFDNLSPTSRVLLKKNGFSSTGIDIAYAVNQLQKVLAEQANEAYKNIRATEPSIMIGGLEFKTREISLLNNPDIHTWAKMAKTVGFVKPLGVGELKIVEQELLCYEAGEIAHVENIMAGESKKRNTRRLNRMETTLVEEREYTKEEERDSQTTERFAMQKEASEVIKSSSEFDAGVTIAASYGPVFVTADAGYAASTSTTTATSNSEQYAKEVTEKARSRVVERVRTEKTTTMIREFKEKNSHSIENSANSAHIVGIYRWLDKTYLARVRNYGKRMMFQFSIPEPAAFYKYALATGPQSDEVLEPPIDPRLGNSNLSPLNTHLDINDANYHHWAAVYGVSNIEAPPVFFKVVSLAKHTPPHW